MATAIAPLPALSLTPSPAELDGAFFACCDQEQELPAADRTLVAYTNDWRSALWPGATCPRCGSPMALASRPRPKAPKKKEEPSHVLTREELKAKRLADKRANELLVQDNTKEPARTLEEAKRRLLPWGDPPHVGKPLGELPRHVLVRAHGWANAKKRRDRFQSLVADLELVINAPGDMNEFPAVILDEGGREEIVA